MRKLPAARLAAVVSILLFDLGAGALAQGDGGWVGRRVVTRLGTILKVGVAVVDDVGQSTDLAVAGRKRSEFRVYRVERVNRPWLLLEAEGEGAAGWARVECVILFDQALDTITKEIRARPSSALYSTRAELWLNPKEYDIAIADCNEAIRLDQQSTLAYWTRGVTWEKRGHYDRALADFDEAVRIDPNDPHGYSCRAGLRASCPDPKYRDGKGAFDDACRANQLVDGMNAVVFDVLAAACAELGDFDSAVKWQQKALDLLGKDDEKTRKDYNACLELYRDKKPSRIAPVE